MFFTVAVQTGKTGIIIGEGDKTPSSVFSHGSRRKSVQTDVPAGNVFEGKVF